VAALAVAAWSVAGLFLVGVPMAAGPIANAMPPAYREQMADISWSQVNAITQYCDDSDEAAAVLNDLAYRIMNAADVAQREAIWITIVEADFPNAFALPDESIIVTDDLIAMAESPDELVGVIAHEIAHIERNHVMKGVIRQIGAGIFFDVVVGGAGVGQAVAIASVNLTALRYTRGDEAEADARGLDMLDSAGIDPGPLARLFDRVDAMAAEQGLNDIPTILSSHPNSADRAAAARARARPGSAPSLSDAEWAIVRGACGGGELEDEQETPETAPASTD
jgi:predicted Zn-dependent protease